MMKEACLYNNALWNRALNGALLRVEGVFSGGIYLSFPDGAMLMLHDSACGSLPFGAAVRDFTGTGKTLGVEAGMQAALTSETLEFPAAGLVFPVVRRPERTPMGVIAADFLSATAAFETRTEDAFSKAAAPALAALDRGLRENDGMLLLWAAGGLVGLGRGLTPSYDDYLTGLMFCLHYAGCPSAALNDAVLGALDRTNRYSAAFLRAAAEGGFFSLLADCLAAGRGEAIQALLAVGASSGRDMLAGLRAGVKAIRDKLA